ncbi:MAG TPA: hypothetical protein VGQ36_01610 [Thermoanaerobaculia bacterium]|nr:hypothetical protein [Thermoanaerobaculia bacterium]
MTTGVQFSGTLSPGETRRWFTHSWNPAWHVVWSIVPTTPAAGIPQVDWDVAVERASATAATYWITVKNLTTNLVAFEARYAIL